MSLLERSGQIEISQPATSPFSTSLPWYQLTAFRASESYSLGVEEAGHLTQQCGTAVNAPLGALHKNAASEEGDGRRPL